MQVDLSSVDTSLLSAAISILTTATLSKLTEKQCEAIMSQIPLSRTIRNLYLQNVNLSSVPPQLLAEGVCRLRKVNLAATRLTPDQAALVVSGIVKKSRTLREMNLTGVDLSGVPEAVLERALDKINIDYSRNMAPKFKR